MKQQLEQLHASALKLAEDIKALPDSGKYIRLGVAIGALRGAVADNLRCEIEALKAVEREAELRVEKKPEAAK